MGIISSRSGIERKTFFQLPFLACGDQLFGSDHEIETKDFPQNKTTNKTA